MIIVKLLPVPTLFKCSILFILIKEDNWTENTNLTHQIIFALREDSSGNLFAAGYGALFYSNSQGISWKTIATVNSYFSDVLYANGKIYVAIAGNIFYSDDGGLNYKEL